MRVSQRFPIAVHSMLFIARFEKEQRITSTLVAQSTGANSVIIRNIFSLLKENGLIESAAGKNGGVHLAKDGADITLWDIYSSVEADDTNEIFNFHNADEKCPVGRNIYQIMYTHTTAALNAMRKEFEAVTLNDLVHELNTSVKQKKG